MGNPVCPDGYVGLGSIAVRMGNSWGHSAPTGPVAERYRCVWGDLTTASSFAGSALWTDAGSGATVDGGVWGISGSPFFSTKYKSNGKPTGTPHALSAAYITN